MFESRAKKEKSESESAPGPAVDNKKQRTRKKYPTSPQEVKPLASTSSSASRTAKKNKEVKHKPKTQPEPVTQPMVHTFFEDILEGFSAIAQFSSSAGTQAHDNGRKAVYPVKEEVLRIHDGIAATFSSASAGRCQAANAGYIPTFRQDSFDETIRVQPMTQASRYGRRVVDKE